MSLPLNVNVKRVLAKANYRIHTDAIKENLISNQLTPRQISITYASEADTLNVALFGKTAKEWREENPDAKGNIRDFATIEQLIVMVNLENMNAHLISQGLEQHQRLIELNKMACSQLQSFLNNSAVQKIKAMTPETTNQILNPSNSTGLKTAVDNISVDWAIRENVQAKMKMTIKRLLRKYGYPPDKTAKAVEVVMEQTKLMCQNESNEYRYQPIKSEKLKVAEE